MSSCEGTTSRLPSLAELSHADHPNQSTLSGSGHITRAPPHSSSVYRTPGPASSQQTFALPAPRAQPQNSDHRSAAPPPSPCRPLALPSSGTTRPPPTPPNPPLFSPEPRPRNPEFLAPREPGHLPPYSESPHAPYPRDASTHSQPSAKEGPQGTALSTAMPSAGSARGNGNVLSIPPEKVGVLRNGKYTNLETDALLGYLSDFDNYQQFKLKPLRTWEKMAESVFRGTRSADSIKGRWETLKGNFTKAKARIESTGEGEKGPLFWASVRESWLDKLCPYYEKIAEILQSDISLNSPYVSECGGRVPQPIRQSNDRDMTTSDTEATAEVDDDDYHPPIGEKKSPGTLAAKGGCGIKKEKLSSACLTLQKIAEQRLEEDRRRLNYEMERDKADRELQREMEKNRHIERMRRLDLMDKQFELALAKFNAGLGKKRALTDDDDEE